MEEAEGFRWILLGPWGACLPWVSPATGTSCKSGCWHGTLGELNQPPEQVASCPVCGDYMMVGWDCGPDEPIVIEAGSPSRHPAA